MLLEVLAPPPPLPSARRDFPFSLPPLAGGGGTGGEPRPVRLDGRHRESLEKPVVLVVGPVVFGGHDVRIELIRQLGGGNGIVHDLAVGKGFIFTDPVEELSDLVSVWTFRDSSKELRLECQRGDFLSSTLSKAFCEKRDARVELTCGFTLALDGVVEIAPAGGEIVPCHGEE